MDSGEDLRKTYFLHIIEYSGRVHRTFGRYHGRIFKISPEVGWVKQALAEYDRLLKSTTMVRHPTLYKTTAESESAGLRQIPPEKYSMLKNNALTFWTISHSEQLVICEKGNNILFSFSQMTNGSGCKSILFQLQEVSND